MYAQQQATRVRPLAPRPAVSAHTRPGPPGPAGPARGRRRVLTAREAEVLDLIARGRTKVTAAAELGIAPQTVKSHLGHIFAALGARNAAHAVAIGHCCGVLGPGRATPPAARGVEVTRREIEILVSIARGMTDDQIGRRLTISRDTVKTHLRRIYAKLEVGSRVQAVDQAFRSGLLVPRPIAAGPGAQDPSRERRSRAASSSAANGTSFEC